MRVPLTTAALVACALVAFAGLATGAGTSWSGNFESGNFNQYAAQRYCEGEYSCTIVKRPATQGRFAARFEVRPGDDYGHWSGERAQVATFTREQEDADSYWGWSVYLPRDYRDSKSFFQVFAEWHHSGLTGSPPVTFQVINGRYVVRIVRSADPAQAIFWDQYDLGPITPGRWTRFIYHARWSTDPKQAVNEIWVNGMLRRRIEDHPNLFVGYWNYLVVGWYRAAADITQVVYIDDVRMGTSLATMSAITGLAPTRLAKHVLRLEALASTRGPIAVIARDAERRAVARWRIVPAKDGRIRLDLRTAAAVAPAISLLELRPVSGAERPATLRLPPAAR
jgi:hypothetical protein